MVGGKLAVNKQAQAWTRAYRLVAALALLVMMMTLIPQAVQAELLKGRIEDEYLRIQPKVNRQAVPGMPTQAPPLRIDRGQQALQGSAVDTSAFAPLAGQAKADALSGQVVDTQQFPNLPKTFDIGADRSSRELVLAWERWHKQLSEAIYRRWQSLATESGKATVRIVVTRDRVIRCDFIRSNGGPAFEAQIFEAVSSLNGNQGLTFPSKSQRYKVAFEADYIAGSDVRPGYSWVKNDYERVRE